MTTTTTDLQPSSRSITEPFPIFQLSNRYLLYDIDTITYLRRTHLIGGVLIGSLPQLPQQNLFLGVPLQLLPEEARLLVERGIAYIVDDRKAHREGYRTLRDADRAAYRKSLREKGLEAARDAARKAEARKEAVLKRLGRKEFKISRATSVERDETCEAERSEAERADAEDGDSFQRDEKPQTPSGTESIPETKLEPYTITPTTSYPPLHTSPSNLIPPLIPDVPPSYPLFAHLHDQGYFMSPGLRFGCQYMVYPGDPLRFHSHFLAVGVDWDEELDLMDIVGGGRLGTGVKKGFLMGGVEKGMVEEGPEEKEKVRTFCIEWGGM